MSYITVMFPDNRIRELRKKAGLTQTELGQRIGLHQTQIGKLESSGRNLTFEWARRIAAALDVRMVDLLDDNDNPDRLEKDERTIVQNYRQASEEQQELLKRVAEPVQRWVGVEGHPPSVTPTKLRA